MDISFNNKKVFLTGGGGTIGSSIKTFFLNNGAYVDAPGSDELDLSSIGAVKKYFDLFEGSPDIFIHCAGINKLSGIEEIEDEVIKKVFQVNCFSAVEVLKRVVPAMRKKQFGRIVIISSLYGIVSRERRVPYSSSKHALNGLVKSVALETAADNVLINAVAPGYIKSKMTDSSLSKNEQKEILKTIPTGRFQMAEEIAHMCGFLCSEYNQSMTGQVFPVDGGFLCR